MDQLTNQFIRKAIAVATVLYVCLCSVFTVFAEQDGPDVLAEAYCVMNRKDGSVVYSKNMDETLYPASITKIMTALVTIEHCDNLDDIVVFNSEVMESISSNSSTLSPVALLDEEMTVRDALFGLMLNSANECASALAVYTAGSIDAFVEMMNEKAQELGAVNTHYMNAHGLDDENHYTTAYDMALIFNAALENDIFRYIDSSASYTIPATNKYGERTCASTNQFINGSLPYEGVYAGKTGHTGMAGRTLVTAAYRNGMDLICVIMKSDNNHFYSDTETLLDHAFLKVQGNTSETYTAVDDTVSVRADLTSGLNVRAYPSTYSDRIGSLAAGEAVHRIGTFGTWSCVETSAGTGYVSSEYLIGADGSPVTIAETVNNLTEDQTVPAPDLSSRAADEAEPGEKQEEASAQTSPVETQQEASTEEARLDILSGTTAAVTIPEQTFRYQLTVDILTLIVVGVIFLIAIIIAVIAVVMIARRNKDSDEDAGDDGLGDTGRTRNKKERKNRLPKKAPVKERSRKEDSDNQEIDYSAEVYNDSDYSEEEYDDQEYDDQDYYEDGYGESDSADYEDPGDYENQDVYDQGDTYDQKDPDGGDYGDEQ